ncbi:hypothetical protein E8E15_000036 [Penicillium rubens]|nr:hypothetical protein E8E15_000036 [Penicillium rubens]KAJ5249346.1 hypothetical protein N7524_011662 [Penicillium chrysogenum]KAJ5249567.1 hypothetical protein N7524_011883 [Penicillium chrysogenum]
MACILEIQIQGACSYSETSKGKSQDPTDEGLAFQLQKEQLEAISHTLKDRRMVMSFAAAVQADGRILAESQAEEELEPDGDREVVQLVMKISGILIGLSRAFMGPSRFSS